MSPESDKPDEQPPEDAPRVEAAGAADAPAEADDDRAASDADTSSATAEAEVDDAAEPEAPDTDASGEDEEPDVEDSELEQEAEEPEPEADAAAPRRRRRRSAEPEAEKPAKPAPRRRRSQRDPALPPPVVRAQAKYVRSSARKARLVCDHIRGKSVDEARAILALTPRGTARDWSKLLESAVANAEHNHELVGEDLYIKAVHADEGPTIPRFRPRARGRATKIRKRTSHLTVLLTPKD
jgi:large subunit ribosomal protein L22